MIRFRLMVVFSLMQLNFAIVLGSELQLRLVSVVHRHGDRTPAREETYSNDPYASYTYYPIRRGGLTNGGKQRVYQLGQVLRSRYCDFLGSIYDPIALEARSTDFGRTKMSLQLVLSALYPPLSIQKWNSHLAWQPIPTTYSTIQEDILMIPEFCSQYNTEYNRVKNTAEVQRKVAALADTMTALTELTGQTINSTFDLYMLYHTFDAQRSAGLKLPEWVYKFYPNGELFQGTVLEYEIGSYNDYLKRIHGGILLRRISDTMIAYVNGSLDEGRKLFLYSGHETNIASLLLTLGVYEPHVPAYSSAVFIELWEQKKEYFVKVLYYTGIPANVITQRIPGCSDFCPINKFSELLAPVIATDADLQCPSRQLTSFVDSSNRS